MSAVGPIYPKWAWSFCALEAGYMRLLLRREAETCGVPLHPLGGALLTFLRQPLGLESSDIWCCSLASQPGDRSEPPKPESPKWAPIDDHVQRLTFKLSQPGLPNPRTVLSRVALPLVGDTDQQRQTFCRRRSARAYLPQTLTLETFAAYLAQLRPTHLRICICLTGHAVAGLEAGAWLYDSANHSLQLIQAGAAIARTDHVLINRPIHDTASFMLFMVAPDSPQVRDADLIHAGELGQILQDDGFPHQIAVCALGVMESNDNIRAMFQLGPNDQILQNFIGGPVPPETFSMFQAYQEQQAVIRQMVSELPAEDRAKGAGSDLEDGEARPLLRHSLTDEQLKRFLADRLPHYMVPGIYLYLARLPLTDNGKVDRKALPQPDARTASTHQGEGIPTDDLEQLIADLIAQILNQTKVGTYDNFFELGANSLQLVQLQGRLQEELQQQVPITTLFSNPTVVALAGALRGTEQETAKQEGQERAKMRQKAQQRKKPGR